MRSQAPPDSLARDLSPRFDEDVALDRHLATRNREMVAFGGRVNRPYVR